MPSVLDIKRELIQLFLLTSFTAKKHMCSHLMKSSQFSSFYFIPVKGSAGKPAKTFSRQQISKNKKIMIEHAVACLH